MPTHATGAERRPGHIGLASVRERISALGGAVTVRSRPGGGTTVEFVLPLGVTDGDAADDVVEVAADAGVAATAE
jgi:signal transduction histidine kinase